MLIRWSGQLRWAGDHRVALGVDRSFTGLQPGQFRELVAIVAVRGSLMGGVVG